MPVKERIMGERNGPSVKLRSRINQTPGVLGPSKYFNWPNLFYGFLVFTFAFTFAGAQFLKSVWSAEWASQFQKFRWLVLVQGAQIEIDEVGRYLKDIKGVDRVVYISPEAALKTVQSQIQLKDEGTFFKYEDLPASWQVAWDPETLMDANFIEEMRSEIAQYPGVVDVAYDLNQWDIVLRFKKFSYYIKNFLSIGGFFVLVLVLLFIGKTVFLSPFQWPDGKTSAKIIAIDLAFWIAGVALAGQVLGPAHPMVYSGGLLLGLLHLVWINKSQTSL